MKLENPYLQVLKTRYLSLIAVPILAVSGPIYFAYCYFTNNVSADQLIMGDIPVILFVFVLIIKFLQGLNESYTEAFAQFVRLSIVVITILVWWYYLSTSSARTKQQFQAKRDYYVYEAVKRSENISNDKPLVIFNLKPDPYRFRSIVYDKTDTYYKKKAIKDISYFDGRACDNIVKFEPHFYYIRSCTDIEIVPSDITNIVE